MALNPALSPVQRDDLRSQLETWHIMALDKVGVTSVLTLWELS